MSCQLLHLDVLGLETMSLHLLIFHLLLQCGHLASPLGRLLLLGLELLFNLGTSAQLEEDEREEEVKEGVME